MAEASVVTELSNERTANAVSVTEHHEASFNGDLDDIHEKLKLDTLEFAAKCKKLDCRAFGYRFFKRLSDVIFSLFVIILGFIPGLILSIAIGIDTKGSPIYSQERIGRLGYPFRIYKFRSMVVDSDDVEKHLSPEQLDQWRRERKVDNDPRITQLGKILRKTSLDELPQFINVLLGQMSIVGPRPITHDELLYFGQKIPILLSIEPGITGLWQASARNDATFESGDRQRIELEYVQSASFKQDTKIFFATFGAMFSKKTGR